MQAAAKQNCRDGSGGIRCKRTQEAVSRRTDKTDVAAEEQEMQQKYRARENNDQVAMKVNAELQTRRLLRSMSSIPQIKTDVDAGDDPAADRPHRERQ